MKKKKERENIWLMIKKLNLVSMSCSLREESNEGGFTFKHVNFVLIRFDFELIRECFRVENDFVKVSIMILRCF